MGGIMICLLYVSVGKKEKRKDQSHVRHQHKSYCKVSSCCRQQIKSEANQYLVSELHDWSIGG